MSVALPLFEPELYHDQESDQTAYFTIMRKLASGRVEHESFDVREMRTVIAACAKLPDVYITQGDFRRPQRRIAALKSLGLFWADLGDNGQLASLGESGAIEKILRTVHAADIPYPSFIVASGRGYHAKWLFTARVAWQDLDRWRSLERIVSETLHASLDADLNSIDPTRVLRLVDTINSKTQTVAHIVWANIENKEVVRYDFEEIYRSTVPADYGSREKAPRTAQEARKERAKAPRSLVAVSRPVSLIDPAQTWPGRLWHGRFVDERNVFHGRGWTAENGGVPKGYRDIALFIGATALTWFASPSTWWNETQSLAAEFAPSLRETEWRSYVSTTWQRMMSNTRYRYTNARLAQLLDVSREEMRGLKYLVDAETAQRRVREFDCERDEVRRRARGQVERGRYLAETNEKTLALAAEAHALINQGASLRKAAERLGVSLGAVQNALRVATRDLSL